MALVCCALTISCHDAFRDLGRASAIAVAGIGALGLSIWVMGRQLSFLRLVGLLVLGQLAMHGMVGLTIDRRAPAEALMARAHLPAPGWMPGSQTPVEVLGEDLLLTLVVALVLYGCEYNVWAWFQRAALRLVVAPPLLAPLPTPDPPTLRPVYAAPTFAPLLWVSALGRRGPPATARA